MNRRETVLPTGGIQEHILIINILLLLIITYFVKISSSYRVFDKVVDSVPEQR